MFKKYSIVTALAVVASILLYTTTYAASNCGGIDTSVLSCSSDGGVWDIVILVLTIMAGGVGLVAIGGFVYGAILYASAQDNAGQVSKAKGVIFNVVVGLLLFAGMYSFLQYLIPGGIFNRELANPTKQPLASNNSGNDSGKNTKDDKNKDKEKNDNKPKEAIMKLATYNVLGFDHNTSASKYSNEQRMVKAAELLKSYNSSLSVINEINAPVQRSIILNNLPGWRGTGLASSNQDVIIIWDSSVYELQNLGTYSIPVIPGRPQRPQPWAKLQHRESKQVVFMYGLHLSLDNGNQAAGAYETLRHVRDRQRENPDATFIIAGDMNSNDGADRVTYNIFAASGMFYHTRRNAKELSGNNCDTHHSLGSQDCRPTKGSHIDQIWISRGNKVVTESYNVVANAETAHISDHNPIIIKIRIPAKK